MGESESFLLSCLLTRSLPDAGEVQSLLGSLEFGIQKPTSLTPLQNGGYYVAKFWLQYSDVRQ